MGAPKCKFCGEKHFVPICPSILAPIETGLKVEKPLKAPLTKIIESELLPTFDRTAYQREYMRKRRAKAKEAKP